MNNLMRALAIVAVVFASSISSFRVAGINGRQNSLNGQMKSNVVSNTKLNMDATLIPMIVGATGLIFAGEDMTV